MRGVVKWFNPTKGFGFISPDDGSRDVFVHISQLQKARMDTLDPGDKVEFDSVPGKKGNEAQNIRIVAA